MPQILHICGLLKAHVPVKAHVMTEACIRTDLLPNPTRITEDLVDRNSRRTAEVRW